MEWDLTFSLGTLKCLSEQDLPAIRTLYSHAELAHSQARPRLDSEQQHRQQLQQMLQAFRQHQACYWLVYTHDSQLAGIVGLHSINWSNNSAQLMVELLPAFRNIKGLLYQCCGRVMGCGFNELALHRLEAMILKDNRRLSRYLQQKGFVLEGVLPARSRFQGQWLDYSLYSMLDTDSAWKVIAMNLG